jgi:hypothetical protein
MRIGNGIFHTNFMNGFQNMQKSPQCSGDGDLRRLCPLVLTVPTGIDY